MTRLVEDRALLDAFRRGEKPALEEVFRHYAPGLARALRAGITIDHQDGSYVAPRLTESELEVIVQDTFIRALSERSRNSYDGLRPFSTWLVAIARNLMIDRARRVAYELDLKRTLAQTAASSTQGDLPERAVDDRRIHDLVEQSRATLDAEEQRVFRARYDEELSLRETARQLSMSLIRVRRVDVRLRTRLLRMARRAGFLIDHGKAITNPGVERNPEGDGRGGRLDEDES